MPSSPMLITKSAISTSRSVKPPWVSRPRPRLNCVVICSPSGARQRYRRRAQVLSHGGGSHHAPHEGHLEVMGIRGTSRVAHLERDRNRRIEGDRGCVEGPVREKGEREIAVELGERGPGRKCADRLENFGWVTRVGGIRA